MIGEKFATRNEVEALRRKLQLALSGATIVQIASEDTSGVSNFTDLADVPSAYTACGNFVVRVKSTVDELEFAELKGTTNQVTVTANAADYTLSLPQDIHTAATPTFAGMYLQSASAAPFLKLTNASDTERDPIIQFAVGATPVTKFTMGVNDSSDDRFALYSGDSLSPGGFPEDLYGKIFDVVPCYEDGGDWFPAAVTFNTAFKVYVPNYLDYIALATGPTTNVASLVLSEQTATLSTDYSINQAVLSLSSVEVYSEATLRVEASIGFLTLTFFADPGVASSEAYFESWTHYGLVNILPYLPGGLGNDDSILRFGLGSDYATPDIKFTMGVDDSDADSFKLSAGDALGTTDIIRVTTSDITILNGGELRFQDGAETNYVGLVAAASVTASYTLVLPVATAGAKKHLLTDASNNLGWGQNVDTDGTPTLANLTISNGSAPSPPADSSAIYSADAGGIAGHAAPHWIGEAGGIASLECGAGTVNEYRYYGDIANDATLTLPFSITSSARGFIAAGNNEERTDFWIDNDGDVILVNNSTNVVANADTDDKLCIGTAAAQEPLQIKNRLNATKKIFLVIWYN
jgi:hypothetical protein